MTQFFQVNPQSKLDVIGGRCGSVVSVAFMSRDRGVPGGSSLILCP